MLNIDSFDMNKQHINGNMYNNNANQLGYYGFVTHPLSGTTTVDTLRPIYGSAYTDQSINPDPFKSDSGLSYSLPVSRKRSRDDSPIINRNTFLGEDISSQIHQQQFEIDQFIHHHNEKLRVEVEERRKKNSRTLIAALEEGIANRLRAKDDEITKMTKLNYALEEKVKSLCLENQIWRELAQTNEATANALRGNLKYVLEQAVHDDYRGNTDNNTVGVADDAESCCESNDQDEHTIAEQDSGMKRIMCKNCWKEETCVLLLPCRHLCLCTGCASSVDICPVCKSTKNITLNINMSS